MTTCTCGAPAEYTIRESVRGYETIHRVCDDCFQCDFQNNEENCAGWEVVYAIPDGQDGYDDVPAGDGEPQRCRNCGAPHHIQQCPEVWQALRQGRQPQPRDLTTPTIVRKTIIAWQCERQSCTQWLASFNDLDRWRLANAVVAYRKQFYPDSTLTVDQLLAAWDAAITNLFPPRPAVAMRLAA